MHNTDKTNAAKGLKKLSFFFIRERVTRYQYMALIYYLRKGTGIDNNANPSLILKDTFGSWDDYYVTSVSEYSPGYICDCQSHDDFWEHVDKMVENYYFYDRTRNVYLNFLRKYGDKLTNGHLWILSRDWSNYDTLVGNFIRILSHINGTELQ
jgi:hypothetical protein